MEKDDTEPLPGIIAGPGRRRRSKGPFKCYVTQWVGVYGSAQISVTKLHAATLLLRGVGVSNLQKKYYVTLDWPIT